MASGRPDGTGKETDAGCTNEVPAGLKTYTAVSAALGGEAADRVMLTSVEVARAPGGIVRDGPSKREMMPPSGPTILRAESPCCASPIWKTQLKRSAHERTSGD